MARTPHGNRLKKKKKSTGDKRVNWASFVEARHGGLKSRERFDLTSFRGTD